MKKQDLSATDQRVIHAHERSLVTLNRSPKTIQCRHDVLMRLAGWLNERDLSLASATPQALSQWQSSIGSLAAESRRSYTCHVRAFYEWRCQLGDENPAVALQVPRVRRGRPRPISEDDLVLALRMFGEPCRTWILLSAYLGLRAGEVAAINRDDVIDDEDPAMLYVRGKGDKTRVVPLPDPLVQVLRPSLYTTGPLWRRPKGGRATGPWVSRSVSAEFHRIGLPYTLHNCRHRLGTILYRESRDIRMVQEVLGHASPATTAIYTQVSPAATVSSLTAVSKNLNLGDAA